MATIRALTFFVPIENQDAYEDELSEYFGWIDTIINNFPFEAWTTRVVLPPIKKHTSLRKWMKIIDYIIDNLSIDNALIHGITLGLEDPRIGEVGKLLDAYPNLFGNIIYKHSYSDKLVNLYRDGEVDKYTRFAITFNDPIMTPYFPATTNKRNIFGFSIALRYIDLIDSLLNGDEEKIADYLNNMDNKLSEFGSLYLGIDLSLSPWMEESIARLVEDRFGVAVGKPGSYYAIYKLNKLINEELIRKLGLNTIGFNEVMLPVGEDNRLMELVKDGELTLSSLIGLTSVCVAGLDMVVIEKNEELMTNVAKDLYSISSIKKKTMAMRIIPSDEEEVFISRFGNIPKIRKY